MSVGEWMGPAAIGVIGALLIVFFVPEPVSEAPFVPSHEDLGVVFPFPNGPVGDTARSEILVLADPARPATLNVTVHGELAQPGQVTWHNDHIGTMPIESGTIYCIRAPCPQPEAPWLLRPPQDGARFDPDNQTVRLTLYAFNALGELVASNAPAVDVDRFHLYGDYIPFGDLTWYVGNQTPPPHAETLPFGADVAAEALDGLPVGGISTVHLETHPYDWLTGELWLTAQVTSFADLPQA